MSAQVAADLRAAADVLERDGWTRFRYHSGSGCHCAQGALGVAITGNPQAIPDGSECNLTAAELDRWEGANQAVARWLSGAYDSYVPDWNDDDNRTATEVIAALRAAADSAEADQ
jgi:hypothetical protein